MINRKYGVVYTPESLAEFTAQLIAGAAKEHGKTIKTVLDPACGECLNGGSGFSEPPSRHFV